MTSLGNTAPLVPSKSVQAAAHKLVHYLDEYESNELFEKDLLSISQFVSLDRLHEHDYFISCASEDDKYQYSKPLACHILNLLDTEKLHILHSICPEALHVKAQNGSNLWSFMALPIWNPQRKKFNLFEGQSFSETEDKVIEFMQALNHFQVDLNTQTRGNGVSALHIFSKRATPRILESFVAFQPDLNIEDSEKKNALIWCMEDQANITYAIDYTQEKLKILIESGIDYTNEHMKEFKINSIFSKSLETLIHYRELNESILYKEHKQHNRKI